MADPTPAPASASTPSRPRPSYVSPLRFLFKSSLLIAILSFALSQMITESWTWGKELPSPTQYYNRFFPPKERIFTLSELSKYDGISDPSSPIYLSILGNVYDVSSNPDTYGPGGGYHFFAGRDASRAFVTGCFKKVEDGGHLTHDVRGLDSNKEKRSLNKWYEFFENSPRYPKVGTVILPVLTDKDPIPGPCV